MEQVTENKPFGIKRSRNPHGDLRATRPGPRGHSHLPYAGDRDPVAGSLAGLGGCQGGRAGSSAPAAGLGGPWPSRDLLRTWRGVCVCLSLLVSEDPLQGLILPLCSPDPLRSPAPSALLLL